MWSYKQIFTPTKRRFFRCLYQLLFHLSPTQNQEHQAISTLRSNFKVTLALSLNFNFSMFVCKRTGRYVCWAPLMSFISHGDGCKEKNQFTHAWIDKGLQTWQHDFAFFQHSKTHFKSSQWRIAVLFFMGMNFVWDIPGRRSTLGRMKENAKFFSDLFKHKFPIKSFRALELLDRGLSLAFQSESFGPDWYWSEGKF